jgi:hypothetical protein
MLPKTVRLANEKILLLLKKQLDMVQAVVKDKPKDFLISG